MRAARHLFPSYSERFRCIGSACEDSCCGQWTVPIDKASYLRCQTLPAGSVRTRVESAFVPIDRLGAASGSRQFAQIRMTEAGMCPLLGEDRLCQLQESFGEEYLPETCRVYPRVRIPVRGIQETALALSCPEAARAVLLGPALMIAREREAESGCEGLEPFLSVRDFAVRLIGRRGYPLWQRLIVLGLFSRRLDADPDALLSLVGEFDAALTGGQLGAALQRLETDGEGQLDVVLRLAGLMLHRSKMLPRFEACLDAFRKGIGFGQGATLESLSQGYERAHDRYFAPFFERHPHILENYLTNLMVQRRFPFGKGWAEEGTDCEFSMTKEYLALVAQFVLMKGLLIGVAGHRQEQFQGSDVVATMQAAAKHFEHHPEFQPSARTLLVESREDGLLGLATLLRNGDAGKAVRQQTSRPSRDVHEPTKKGLEATVQRRHDPERYS